MRLESFMCKSAGNSLFCRALRFKNMNNKVSTLSFTFVITVFIFVFIDILFFNVLYVLTSLV